VNFAPPAPSAVNHAVPELLDYIVAKMLAKPLEERYQKRAGTGAGPARVRAPTRRAAGFHRAPRPAGAGERTAAGNCSTRVPTTW